MAALTPPFRANNMKELYAKIQKGIYNRIPSFYSDDLAEIINLCLKVNPASRPSAKEILEHPKIKKNMPSSEMVALDYDQTKKANLIKTILCPRNLRSLKMALPGAKYDESQKKRPISMEGARGIKRSVSAKNNLVSPHLYSPKGGLVGREIKYAIQRKPSSDKILNPYGQRRDSSAEVRERQISRGSR